MVREEKKDNAGIETLMQGVELDITPQEEVKKEIPLHKTKRKLFQRQ